MIRKAVDTAIVGGGVSGLYSAWRLSQSGVPASLNVYEASERLGGRLDTVEVPALSCKVEMGAMRFTSSQLLVSRLLSHLNVPSEAFVNSTLQHMYLRGVSIPMGPSGPLGPVPYRLAGLESAYPFVLLVQAMERAVPNALSLTPVEWAQTIRDFRLGGKPLWEWGFWNLIQSVISNEGYQLISAGLGEQSISANWSAASALPMMCQIIKDVQQKDGLNRPTGGWVTLVDHLAAKIVATPGCNIEIGHTLRSIRAAANHEYPIELLFESAEEATAVSAKNVVLALPREALERVEFGREISRETKLINLFQQVMQIPAFKLYVAYDSPWWTDSCGWSDGYSITDLPIRQVYYGAGQAGTPDCTGRILMASYADFSSVQFWTGLTGMGSGQRNRIFQENGSGGPLNAVLQVAAAQLREFHGIYPKLPEPVWSAYADWSRGNYGAGWHAWLPGLDPNIAIPNMRKPFGELPIYICGEAFSYYQGWVEGALSSAELMLEQHFNLAFPDWLPSGYYLGP
jgi:monoamine oxidase